MSQIYRAPRGGGANGGTAPPVTRGRGGARGRGGRGASRGAAAAGAGGAPAVDGAVFVRGGRTVRGRGGRGAARVGTSASSNEANIELSGFPADAVYQDVVNFWNSNAPAGLRFIRMSFEKGHARVTLTADQVPGAMSALQGKQIAAGRPLIVQLGASAGRALSNAERESLRAAVSNCYDASSRSVNLQSLAATHGLPFANFQSTSFMSELFNALAIAASDAVSVNLAHNSIQSLQAFPGLLRVVPKLENLSLQANYLVSVDQLEPLASVFKGTLRELLLSGNPLCQSFTSAPGAQPQHASQLDYGVYQQYVSSMFPALRLLDGSPLAPLIQFDLPPALSNTAPMQLPPLKDSFFDSETHKKMCFALVTRYFELYDRNRQDRDLTCVYADTATFSLTYQPDPRHANAKYTEQNRNIILLAGAGAKNRHTEEIARLRTGPVAIVTALHQLPTSRHDVEHIVADVCKIPSADARINAMGGLLHITLRGVFLESESIVRCFHRVWLCSAPTGDAQAKGWPVSILHDTLYIGATKANPQAPAARKSGAEVQAAALALAGPAAAPVTTANGVALTAHDQQLVAGLCQATGVDPNTATQLLMQCQGNVEAAMEAVKNMRAQGRQSL